MKKFALMLIAGSLVIGTQSFANVLDNKIDEAMQTFEDNGAFASLNYDEIETLHNIVKDRVIDLELKPEQIDQAFLSSLISGGLSILKGLAGKVFGALKGLGEKLLGTLTKAVGTKGTAIVGSLVNKVKGITGDQIKEVAKRVAQSAAEETASSVIASAATDAIKAVTGKVIPKQEQEAAIEEGEQAAAEAK